jgi:cytochrome c-type biogenesis protein CcmH/NrfG
MPEPTKPGSKASARPAARQGGRASGRAVAPPPRPAGNRARAIFAILGLLVVFSLLFGLVAIGFNGIGRATPTQDPYARSASANLIATYEAKLRDNPNDVNTMIILANILQNQSDFQGAIGWYEKAIALQPDNVEARLAFGKALGSYGQNFDAEAQYRKALEIDPKNAKAEFYLGDLNIRWNPPRPDEARVHYTRASELEPEGAWGRAARGVLDQLNATPTPQRGTPTP